MNDLYGWGLSEYLSYGWFKWLKPQENNILEISD